MTEQEIISGCKQEKALYQEALVKRYSSMLMTVCRRYAIDEHLVWDLLQETLINILKGIIKYQPTGSFEAWMRRIAVTTALKYIDRKYWKQEIGNLESCELSVQIDLEDNLGAEELLNIINKLPNGFRQIFNLFVIEGYSHREISELLGIKESSSRSQLTRARQLLQKVITQHEKINR